MADIFKPLGVTCRAAWLNNNRKYWRRIKNKLIRKFNLESDNLYEYYTGC